MINIEYCPEKYMLRAKGHAGYAKRGSDIVCAAASALVQTLALCILSYKHGLDGEPIVQIGETGDEATIISCKPKEEREREISLLYWYCIQGLDALACQYPENIGITVFWQEGGKDTESRT